MQLPEALNDVEASRVLGLKSPQTLRNWRHLRKGPPYCRIGRRIVYQITDLVEYLRRHRVEPENVA